MLEEKKSVKAHLEINPCILKYLVSLFKGQGEVVYINCVTEVSLPNGKQIRPHPNYQGEGEWSDWITHSCPNSRKVINRSLRVFQLEKYNRVCPSQVVLIILGINNKLLKIPTLIVQT